MTALDDILADEQDVDTRRTPVGVAIALVVAAGLVFGGLAAGAVAFGVAVSHTDQGLCGNLGVPCTSLSVDRVESLSGVKLPAGSTVSGVFFNRTSTGTDFWASVVLPDSARDPGASADFQPYGITITPAEKKWAAGKKSLRYVGFFDGNILHSVIDGVDRAGHRELFLSYTAPSNQ